MDMLITSNIRIYEVVYYILGNAFSNMNQSNVYLYNFLPVLPSYKSFRFSSPFADGLTLKNEHPHSTFTYIKG